MMKLHDVTMSGAYRIFSTAAARCWMLLIPMRRRKEEGTSETSSSLRGRQALTDAPRVGSVSFDGAAPASCHGCPDQKMEALGRLTGGVAHEFNNLLTVVLGNATSLRLAAQTRGDDHEVRKASAIEQAAQRGGRLAAQLLAYSQRQALLPRILSVFDVLSNLHDLLSRAAGEAVQLRLHADDDLWRCHLDEGELEAAALNLVLNARDAMPTGGLVSITCRNERVEAAPLGHGARTPGDYVRLDVADSGIGIPEELHQRVF
ncbi:MAG: hypothetical protein JSS43_07105, partial [Proteobacteria bacterium]|nr:hypothetical protein [Pseudomonadota bacterium]